MSERVRIAVIVATIAGLQANAIAAPTAEELYNQGQAAYDQGDFATATAKYQESYKLSGLNVLLFDIAQAYRQNGQCKEALYTYRRWVAVDPKAAADRAPGTPGADADHFIRELEPQCGAPPPTPTPTPTPTPPTTTTPTPTTPTPAPTPTQPTDPNRTERLAGIATGGAGVVFLVTGIAFGAHSQTLGDEVTAKCGSAGGCDWSKEKPTDDAGRRDATLGRVFDVVGIAGIVGGAALYYLGMRSEVAVTPIATAHDSGAVLTWSRSW